MWTNVAAYELSSRKLPRLVNRTRLSEAHQHTGKNSFHGKRKHRMNTSLSKGATFRERCQEPISRISGVKEIVIFVVVV